MGSLAWRSHGFWAMGGKTGSVSGPRGLDRSYEGKVPGSRREGEGVLMTGRQIRAVLWAVVVLSVGAGGCGSSDLLGPDALQGIEGIALLGPLCPVVSEDDPCPDRPFETSIDVRRPSGKRVARIRTGEDGRFRVGLRPGSYVLDPVSGDPFPVSAAQDVEVVEGVYTQVVVTYDTGIR